jgi:tetratricopeptide (TPR) repeat protein
MRPGHFDLLVEQIAVAFGLKPQHVKREEEGLLLETPDRVVYAFYAEGRSPSLPAMRALLERCERERESLVVLTPGPLSPGVRELLEDRGVPFASGERFRLLLENLGLGSPASASIGAGVLPTAHQLDETMGRARHWASWGVPALALRFFEQAERLKPEYIPAMIGEGESFLALGRWDEAEGAFERARSLSPEHWGALLGLARVKGARGQVRAAVREIEDLLQKHPRQPPVRAHLVDALVSLGRWKAAAPHLDSLLELNPKDPYLHALRSVCARKLGHAALAEEERLLATRLGMSEELWEGLERQIAPSTPEGPGRARPHPI